MPWNRKGQRRRVSSHTKEFVTEFQSTTLFMPRLFCLARTKKVRARDGRAAICGLVGVVVWMRSN